MSLLLTRRCNAARRCVGHVLRLLSHCDQNVLGRPAADAVLTKYPTANGCSSIFASISTPPPGKNDRPVVADAGGMPNPSMSRPAVMSCKKLNCMHLLFNTYFILEIECWPTVCVTETDVRVVFDVCHVGGVVL